MFNQRSKIKTLLDGEASGQEVIVMGWVRTFRNNQFIALNDGSTNTNLQVVVELGSHDETLLKRITTSAALKVKGILVPSLGKGQKMELKASSIEVLGDSDAEKYPLQPKKHTLEFLREIAHLRFRTNTFGSVFRVRHSLAFAIHEFFNKKGFVYIHTPIVTGSDAEGEPESKSGGHCPLCLMSQTGIAPPSVFDFKMHQSTGAEVGQMAFTAVYLTRAWSEPATGPPAQL